MDMVQEELKLLTGDSLRKFVFEEQTKIKPLCENLIYQKSIVMMSGDPGVGKSTINANIIRDLSVGIPVFNFFYTPNPVITYYIPFERGAYEIAERLRDLSRVTEPNWNNIVIKPDFIGFDMFEGKQSTYFVDHVRRDLDYLSQYGREIVVMLDPIISMVSGEIKEEKYAKAITRCANTIQTSSNCALLLTNHTTKASSRIKDKSSIDPFYGSQTFKAFCTCGIYIYRNTKVGGIHMQSTKTSHGNSIENIHLSFDHFTYSLFAKSDNSGIKNYDKVLAAVRAIKITGAQKFTFSQIAKHELCKGVSSTAIKTAILHEEPFKSGIKPYTQPGKPTILYFNENPI